MQHVQVERDAFLLCVEALLQVILIEFDMHVFEIQILGLHFNHQICVNIMILDQMAPQIWFFSVASFNNTLKNEKFTVVQNNIYSC